VTQPEDLDGAASAAPAPSDEVEYALSWLAAHGVTVLDREGVAELMGWTDPGTVSRFMAEDRERYGFPAPDGYVGGHPWWWSIRIAAYKAGRPGRGAGGGRPPKTPEGE
jgi:hypothetical protein